ncbi:MAG: holo-ACP synthase [Armatimonadetes bacterium]|nr:holo-ACP synthase [Armatimonadota bacterium]
MKLSTGIDIISVDRVRALMENAGEKFLHRWFSAEEIAYCAAKARPSQHYAARLAAKEAAVKALGHGWGDGILLQEITVSVEPSGAPRLLLAGRAGEIAKELGVAELHVSLSHCTQYAVASVIAVFRPS